jgi:hypothetical protein
LAADFVGPGRHLGERGGILQRRQLADTARGFRLEVSLRDLRDEAVPFAAPRDRLAGEGNDDGQ